MCDAQDHLAYVPRWSSLLGGTDSGEYLNIQCSQAFMSMGSASKDSAYHRTIQNKNCVWTEYVQLFFSYLSHDV